MSLYGGYYAPVPKKLSDIPLYKWVAFYNAYGRDLERREKELANTDDNEALLHYNVDNALCNYCFYTGKPIELITQDELPDVLREQYAAFASLTREESELNYTNTFLWADAVWKIQPVITMVGKVTQSEFDIITDIALIFSDLQDGKHEALYSLCAAYMRKENEPYNNSLLDAEGERMALMKTLPLHMALCTKHYIEDTIKIYLATIKR